MKCPKPKPLKDKKYREWIKRCMCYACAYDSLYHYELNMWDIAMHTISMQDEQPLSIHHHCFPGKDDRYLIPLCLNHHTGDEGIHKRGKETCKKEYEIDSYENLSNMYHEEYVRQVSRKV